MANEPAWTRAYLKSKGAQDNEIDYQNGAVTYKNKPFQYTTPQADGKAYGSLPELESLYKSYQNNDAMEQLKASSAGRMNEVNSTLGQVKQNISKPVTPFTYDQDSVKSDPLYTSGLASYTADTNRGTNQALVNLGRRGIGNSQSAQVAEHAGQQSINNYAATKLSPMVIAQKYQQYLDTNRLQEQQNQNLLGYANSLSGLGQQDFNNARLLGNDFETSQRNAVADAYLAEDRGYANQDRNIKRAKDLQTDYGVPIKPTEDYSQALAQVEGLKTVAQKKEEAEGQKAAYENAWNQFETIGRVTAELAPILGLPEGTTTQQASYQNATLKNSQENTGFDNTLSRDKFNWEKDPNNPNNIYKNSQAEDKNKPETAETYSKYIDSNVAKYSTDDDGNKVLANPREVESAILLSGLDDYEIYKMYVAKGFKWEGPPPAKK